MGVANRWSLRLRLSWLQNYLKKMEEVFGSDGGRLAQMKMAEFNSQCGRLYDSMKKGLNERLHSGSALLKDYSPWLQEFQADAHPTTLEVPGQYHGRSKPLPEYHTHIIGCDEKVRAK